MPIERLHNMERHAQYCEIGIDMLTIRYQDWKKAPQKTAEAMLTYCGCLPDDLSAVYAVLNQGSQADTTLAQSTVKKRWVLSDPERATIAQMLRNHPFINTADYEASGSLKLE